MNIRLDEVKVWLIALDLRYVPKLKVECTHDYGTRWFVLCQLGDAMPFVSADIPRGGKLERAIVITGTLHFGKNRTMSKNFFFFFCRGWEWERKEKWTPGWWTPPWEGFLEAFIAFLRASHSTQCVVQLGISEPWALIVGKSSQAQRSMNVVNQIRYSMLYHSYKVVQPGVTQLHPLNLFLFSSGCLRISEKENPGQTNRACPQNFSFAWIMWNNFKYYSVLLIESICG